MVLIVDASAEETVRTQLGARGYRASLRRLEGTSFAQIEEGPRYQIEENRERGGTP
jgi:hypothetical protein